MEDEEIVVVENEEIVVVEDEEFDVVEDQEIVVVEDEEIVVVENEEIVVVDDKEIIVVEDERIFAPIFDPIFSSENFSSKLFSSENLFRPSVRARPRPSAYPRSGLTGGGSGGGLVRPKMFAWSSLHLNFHRRNKIDTAIRQLSFKLWWSQALTTLV